MAPVCPRGEVPGPLSIAQYELPGEGRKAALYGREAQSFITSSDRRAASAPVCYTQSLLLIELRPTRRS